MPLAERSGRRFHAGGDAVFGMARRSRMQLSEPLQLLHRQVITRQMQQRVQQHRAVPVRDHEPIAIEPLRIGRVVAQMTLPQHLGNLGHAHRHAGMTGVCFLHGVHRQRPKHVDALLTRHRATQLRSLHVKLGAHGIAPQCTSPAPRTHTQFHDLFQVAHDGVGSQFLQRLIAVIAIVHRDDTTSRCVCRLDVGTRISHHQHVHGLDFSLTASRVQQ